MASVVPHFVSHEYTEMIDVVPPLLKSLMISTSPALCSPVNLLAPCAGPPLSLTLFCMNQKPCWASPLLSKRSDPKNNTSQLPEWWPFWSVSGQVVLGVSE